jgi:hypothetical protein
MLLSAIIKNSALFTDEQFSDADLLNIANRAISRINNECNTLFPKYTAVSVDYTALPDDWQLDLVSPYLSYGIKMNDTSMGEADRYLEEFYKSLQSFQSKLGKLIDNYQNGDESRGISPEFIDMNGFGGVYGLNTSNAMDSGWFGPSGNGGFF